MKYLRCRSSSIDKPGRVANRYVSLWFRHLLTDWVSLRRPALCKIPFVLAEPDHGRKIITAANRSAQAQNIHTGMVVADAEVLVPGLEIIDHPPLLAGKLLRKLALGCIRYTPVVALDPPDGLLLDISGCAHLWGGEHAYLREIVTRLRRAGYDTRGAIADTIGAAWAIARYGRETPIIPGGQQKIALLTLPPAALRLPPDRLTRLQKLGFRQVGQIVPLQRTALRRRFGKELLLRLDQAFGEESESLVSVQPVEPYQERLPCLEPICTAGGIEIALTRLLETLCRRLQQEGKGLREAVFKAYRLDGKIEQISVGTHQASAHVQHLFKLFQEKIPGIEPDLGIELFLLEAPKTEDVSPHQESLWAAGGGMGDPGLAELLDRIGNKIGANTLHRYLPAERYWPERSIRQAASLDEKAATAWPLDRPRPIHLLPTPDPIEVTAPIPDYPPMLFRHKGRLHKIIRADGPERIENEWWIERVQHRDYYAVEDEEGGRYWIFRSGHYTGDGPSQWFLHGFFA